VVPPRESDEVKHLRERVTLAHNRHLGADDVPVCKFRPGEAHNQRNVQRKSHAKAVRKEDGRRGGGDSAGRRLDPNDDVAVLRQAARSEPVRKQDGSLHLVHRVDGCAHRKRLVWPAREERLRVRRDGVVRVIPQRDAHA